MKESRCPLVTSHRARTALIMRVVRWNRNFIYEACAKSFESAEGGVIARVTGKYYGGIKCANEGREGAAGLKCIGVSAMRFEHGESNVSGAEANVRGVANAKVDVTDIDIADDQNPEMIGGNKIT